jgi:hypothetical protein
MEEVIPQVIWDITCPVVPHSSRGGMREVLEPMPKRSRMEVVV